jgi:hypothetical protein
VVSAAHGDRAIHALQNDSNSNGVSGTLPDGTYDGNTLQELCCRSDAPSTPALRTSGLPVNVTVIVTSDPATTCTAPDAPGTAFRDTYDGGSPDTATGSECPAGLVVADDGLSFKFCERVRRAPALGALPRAPCESVVCRVCLCRAAGLPARIVLRPRNLHGCAVSSGCVVSAGVCAAAKYQ